MSVSYDAHAMIASRRRSPRRIPYNAAPLADIPDRADDPLAGFRPATRGGFFSTDDPEIRLYRNGVFSFPTGFLKLLGTPGSADVLIDDDRRRIAVRFRVGVGGEFRIAKNSQLSCKEATHAIRAWLGDQECTGSWSGKEVAPNTFVFEIR